MLLAFRLNDGHCGFRTTVDGPNVFEAAAIATAVADAPQTLIRNGAVGSRQSFVRCRARLVLAWPGWVCYPRYLVDAATRFGFGFEPALSSKQPSSANSRNFKETYEFHFPYRDSSISQKKFVVRGLVFVSGKRPRGRWWSLKTQATHRL